LPPVSLVPSLTSAHRGVELPPVSVESSHSDEPGLPPNGMTCAGELSATPPPGGE
jgi:hypothetical protein